MRLLSATILCSTILAAYAQAASSNTSAYTTYDLKTCEQDSPAQPTANPDFAGSKLCKGFNGEPQYQITWSADEGSEYVAFGPHGDLACSGQTSLGQNYEAKNTVEWRLQKGAPIATIQRWKFTGKTNFANKSKSWLIVTKLAKTNSCHIGYIEAAIPEANLKARNLADDKASQFDCLKDTATILSVPGTDVTQLPSLTCRP